MDATEQLENLLLDNFSIVCNRNRDEISLDEDILDTGLDSIGMMTIVSQIQMYFDCEFEIDIVDLFLAGTLKNLTQRFSALLCDGETTQFR